MKTKLIIFLFIVLFHGLPPNILYEKTKQNDNNRNLPFLSRKLNQNSLFPQVIKKLDPEFQNISDKENINEDNLLHVKDSMNMYYKGTHNISSPIKQNVTYLFHKPANVSYSIANSKIKNILRFNQTNTQWLTRTLPTFENASKISKQSNFTKLIQSTNAPVVISNYSIQNSYNRKIISPNISPLIVNLSIRNSEKSFNQPSLEYLLFIEMSFEPNRTAVPKYHRRLLRIFLDYNAYYIDPTGYNRMNDYPSLNIETGLKNSFDLDIYSKSLITSTFRSFSFNLTKIFAAFEQSNPAVSLKNYFYLFKGINIGLFTRNSNQLRNFTYDLADFSLYNELDGKKVLNIKTTKTSSLVQSSVLSNLTLIDKCINCLKLSFASVLKKIDSYDITMFEANISITMELFYISLMEISSVVISNDTIIWSGETLSLSEISPIANNISVLTKFKLFWFEKSYRKLVQAPIIENVSNQRTLIDFFNNTLTQSEYLLKSGEYSPREDNRTIIWKQINSLYLLKISQNSVNLIPKISFNKKIKANYDLHLEIYLFSNLSNKLFSNVLIKNTLDGTTLNLPFIPQTDTKFMLIAKEQYDNRLGIKTYVFEVKSLKNLLTDNFFCTPPNLPNLINSSKSMKINLSCVYTSSLFNNVFWNTFFLNLYLNDTFYRSINIKPDDYSNEASVNIKEEIPIIITNKTTSINFKGELVYFAYYGRISFFQFNGTIKLYIDKNPLFHDQNIIGALPVYAFTLSITYFLLKIKKKLKIRDLNKNED